MSSPETSEHNEPNDLDTLFTQQVWTDFFGQLAQFAKKKFGMVPRRAIDEEDVALSAINSFFDGYKAGRFQISERDDIWKLLTSIALRKVIKYQRRFFTQKRGAGKVQGESIFDHGNSAPVIGLNQFQDLNNMPELPEQVFAQCSELLMSLKNEKLRQTAILKMQGYTNREISEQLGCSIARTKQRLASIKSKWAECLAADEAP